MRPSSFAARFARFHPSLPSALLTTFALAVLACASSHGAPKDTLLTVYQSDLALVQQSHQVELQRNSDWVSLPNISRSLIQDSIRIDSATSTPRQQRFLDRPVTLFNLLQTHIGQQIEVLSTTLGGSTKAISVQLMAVNSDGAVIKDNNGRIETLSLHKEHRFRFPGMPAELTLAPQIQVLLDGHPGQQDLDLRYLTRQLGWQAHYDLVVNDTQADLVCHVSVDNQTDQAWDNASIALIAGKPNRASPTPVRRESMARQVMMAADRSMAPGAPSLEQAGPYHLYRLPGQYDLQAGETRQLQLFQATLPVRTLHRFEHHAGGGLFSPQAQNNQEASPARIILQLNNGQIGNEDSQPWPAGLWRIYNADQDKPIRLLGEDLGRATPVGNRLSLTVGEAFDVTALRSQTGFRRVDKKQTLSDWRIELRNAGPKQVEAEVVEHLGNHWDITRESHPRHKTDEHPQVGSAVWRVPLPARSTSVLTYQVRVQRP